MHRPALSSDVRKHCTRACLIWLVLIIATRVSAYNQAVLHSSPDALNPQTTNLIANENITLYYNGSGPVPPDERKSDPPTPIRTINETSAVEDLFVDQIIATYTETSPLDDCSKCIAAHSSLHLLAKTQPVSVVTNALIRICQAIPSFRVAQRYATSCDADYGEPGGLGAWYALTLSQMNMATGDMWSFCFHMVDICEPRETIHINEAGYFPPKSVGAQNGAESSGETFQVLHLSDLHLDSRFDTGSEANCTGYGCCRSYSLNPELNTTRNNASISASRFGDYQCDSPPDLVLSAFTSMPSFFNTSSLAFMIFTGDIVSHDRDKSLSQAYVAYEEETTYGIFATFLPSTPIYVTLGNHDSMPRAFNTPHSLNPKPSNTSTNALSWNYNFVSSLWHKHHWLTTSEASFAASHYGAYATTTKQGLRIISFNSDFWLKDNIFNYINSTNPDPSGTLTWLASELTECEAYGQRAWLIAHVISGYHGDASLPNPTALFYSIVRRFSPHVIAGVFFGHTHQDQVHLFYDFLPDSESLDENGLRDTSKLNFSAPLQTAYIGPSITPLTGLNSGYRLYTVDAKTFDVLGYDTYYANMSNSLDWHRPVWSHLYNTRAAYTRYVPWPEKAPLNATFWDRVASKMLEDSDEGRALFERYEYYERKGSTAPFGRGRDVGRVEKVCYIRNGQGGQRCECNADGCPK